MKDKYERLKDQVLGELKWIIDYINTKHSKEGYGEGFVPDDIRLVDLIGEFKYIDPEDRGNLFAYLSIKSKIDYLDSEEFEYEEEDEA